MDVVPGVEKTQGKGGAHGTLTVGGPEILGRGTDQSVGLEWLVLGEEQR
jgi:hypothetical protein